MIDINKIYSGHALEVLKTFKDKTINMCVTSPPYWGLRDYNTSPVKWNDGWSGELGAEPNFEDYIKHLCDVFDEVKRVLKDDGTCWVNIGDTYGGSSLGLSYGIRTKGKNSILKTTEYLPKVAHSRGKHSKSLLLIPFRFSIEMMNRGWTVRNVIIWHKPNVTPSSAKDRFTVDFEYLFFFSKNKKYYFQQQFEPCKNQDISSSTTKNRNIRTVWNIPSSNYKGAHFATYNPKLIEIPIKAGCPNGGIILDPFIGSGTTAVVAKQENKNYIGIELNLEYIKLAKKRIKQEGVNNR